MGIKPYDYQIELAKQTCDILNKYNIVYLAMEERTGKTLTSFLSAERKDKVKNVLIITKKKALGGWQDTLDKCKLIFSKNYTLINYHSVCKVNTQPYDLVILDEAHAYVSAYPKRGKLWQDVYKVSKGKPIIYLSATPYAQGLQLIYNQLSLSSYSPFKKYKDFYSWYRFFAKRDKNGNTATIYVNGRHIETYKEVETDKVLPYIEHLFITKTRKTLGFEQEPEDSLHYVELAEETKQAYNILLNNSVLDFSVGNKEHKLIADSKMKLRTSLHMLEGGTLKIEDYPVILNKQEKIDYIKDNFGDKDNIVIMYQYIAEGIKLRKAFSKALILQGISYAEGVDLSHKEHLVIYSQDFSTARHTQRRARQANMNRKQPIKVHFLLVKEAISEQVYESVSKNKTNFVDAVFTRKEL